MGIQTDAGSAGQAWRQKAARFNGALHQALLRLAVTVNRGQVAKLSGSGSAKPGSYPVPVRRGNLRRSADWGFLEPMVAYVTAGGASAPYAVQIHEGLGASSRHGRRPFQDDAVRQTDMAVIFTDTLEEILA